MSAPSMTGGADEFHYFYVLCSIIKLLTFTFSFLNAFLFIFSFINLEII